MMKKDKEAENEVETETMERWTGRNNKWNKIDDLINDSIKKQINK